MKTWQKFLIITLVTLAAGGTYLLVVWRHRQNPGVTGGQTPEQHLSADDVAVVRMEFPMHFDDVKQLEGKSVWMKNGYSMPFYPFAGGRVEFARPAGLIPAAQRLDIKKAIKAAAPASTHDNIEHGDRQVLVVFTLPQQTDSYATPVGFVQGADEHYYSDLLFYYDDPHTIYSNWPKETWADIDAHQVKPGMSELETRMAIGMKANSDGQIEGSRTVDYDVNGKHIVVTYHDNHATRIQSQ